MHRERSAIPRGHRARIASTTIALSAFFALTFAASPAVAGALDQVKEAGRIKLGYRSDARPLSYQDASGKPAGYSVALCQRIADVVKTDLGLTELAVEWVPVTSENRFNAVKNGEVHLLCGAETATLARRAEVSFSIPTFPGGVGALLRSDAPPQLRTVLSGQSVAFKPLWRANAGQFLHAQTFTVVKGTTAEAWLASRLKSFQISATVANMDGYDAGIKSVLDRTASAFFGDRNILLDAAKQSPSSGELLVLDRLFTYEPLALALARGDEDLRLVVDRTLSKLYRSGDIGQIYKDSCGEPDESTLNFFKLSALPD